MGNESFPFKLGHFNCLAINDVNGGNGNCLLIDTGEHKVLIETGNGDGTVPPGLLLERLQAAGITPTEIDVVIVSHADADHIGGAVDASGILAFPQARYILSPEEWAFWSSKLQRLQPNALFDEEAYQWGNTLPGLRLPHLRDNLALIEAETEIMPGIHTIATPGHTPGMIAIAISARDEQLLFIGDVLYDIDLGENGQFIGNPEFHAVVDFDPVQAIRTRDRLFAQAAKDRTLLMAYHTPFPGLGYIVQDGQGWQWTPLAASA